MTDIEARPDAAFRRWLAECGPGAERPYTEAEAALVSRAAIACMVARGWNLKIGHFCVRLSYRLGETLT